MKKALFILGYLADEDIDWIIETGKRIDLPEGSTLIESGINLDNLFILIAGELSIRASSPTGDELAIRYPGEILGELSFLDSRPPRESVVTASPVSVIAINRQLLRERLNVDPAFAARFYQSIGVLLASRFRQTMAQLTLRSDSGDAGNDELDPNVESGDELDPELLDHVSIAGHRFEMLSSHFLG